MYYFISDLHLGFLDREKDKLREDIFLQLLQKISIDAKEIFLVGDIFDYWFDYNTVIPKYFYRTLTELHNLKSKNIKIHYLIGNHDFGHYKFFEDELGIKIIKEDLSIKLEEKKFYISHGDGKALNDYGYLLLKKVLRSKISNYLYRIMHPDVGISLASNSSQKSRNYTDKKNYSDDDGLKQFAINKIEEGFDFIVMGHKHRKEYLVHNYNKTNSNYSGTYINLGEWFQSPQVGIFDGVDFKLISVEEFLKRTF